MKEQNIWAVAKKNTWRTNWIHEKKNVIKTKVKTKMFSSFWISVCGWYLDKIEILPKMVVFGKVEGIHTHIPAKKKITEMNGTHTSKTPMIKTQKKT